MPSALQLEYAAILDQDLPMDMSFERGHACSQSGGFDWQMKLSKAGLAILLNARGSAAL